MVLAALLFPYCLFISQGSDTVLLKKLHMTDLLYNQIVFEIVLDFSIVST
jgi:hypothetical protein